jgi:Flp pilus assembly protein TadG
MAAMNGGTKKGRLGRLKASLSRAWRDQRGNVAVLTAVFFFPLMALVGLTYDLSRAYLVKTRVQQGCDAGVLAARRTMTGSTLDANARTQASNFFNMNIKSGDYGAVVNSYTVTDVTDSSGHTTGAVHGHADVDMPLFLGKWLYTSIFATDAKGRKVETSRTYRTGSMSMSADCEAELQVANNDVMFVLDVTGSMNCPAATPSCSNNGDVEASGSKIAGVRTGVVEFYDTLAAATTSDARLRIGFVPYSSNTNVGKLLPANYVSDTWNYQSRIANFNTATSVGTMGSTSSTGYEVYPVSMPQANCALYGQNKATTDQNGNNVPGGSNPAQVGGGPAPTATTWRTYSNNNASGVDWSWTGAADTSGTNRSCRRAYNQASMTYTTRYGFTSWTYTQDQYNTNGFKLGNTVTFADDSALGSVTVPTSSSYNMQELATASGALGVTTETETPWQGCLEERDTVSNATFSSIPSNAYDLQIDLLPSSMATTWHPWWPALIWDRSGGPAGTSGSTGGQPGGDSVVCPKQAAKLAVMSHSDVYNYVNASDFKARGGTYHDVGMIWGARLLSPTGIFASENATAPNGENINRHIIFMTDGTMAPQPTIYGLYGYEKVDRRISGAANTPTSSDLTDRHNSRFSALCTAIKNMNITIWVVAYDQTMTTQLQNCASPGKAFYASNDTQMRAALQQIARQIAELRLSK